MEHLIIDREPELLANWQAAWPGARVVRRSELGSLPVNGWGMRWCRVRADEDIAELVGMLPPASMPTVVLCDAPEDEHRLQALRAGTAGCCNTHAAPEVLRQVALVVENGGLWVGQSLLQQLIGNTARILAQRPVDRKDTAWESLLSVREAQVARLVASGASNKEIAQRLSIGERTVKAHLGAIFDKLAVRDRLQLSLRVNGLSL